jgi:hypothetical protein
LQIYNRQVNQPDQSAKQHDGEHQKRVVQQDALKRSHETLGTK